MMDTWEATDCILTLERNYFEKVIESFSIVRKAKEKANLYLVLKMEKRD